jgi:hypothetical protein
LQRYERLSDLCSDIPENYTVLDVLRLVSMRINTERAGQAEAIIAPAGAMDVATLRSAIMSLKQKPQ